MPSDQTCISSERDQFSVSISMRILPVLDSPRMRRSTSSMIASTSGSVWAEAGAGAIGIRIAAKVSVRGHQPERQGGALQCGDRPS